MNKIDWCLTSVRLSVTDSPVSQTPIQEPVQPVSPVIRSSPNHIRQIAFLSTQMCNFYPYQLDFVQIFPGMVIILFSEVKILLDTFQSFNTYVIVYSQNDFNWCNWSHFELPVHVWRVIKKIVNWCDKIKCFNSCENLCQIHWLLIILLSNTNYMI